MLGAKATLRVLNKVFGWEYISVIHDGQIKTYRVHKSDITVNYTLINGRRYVVHEDGWLHEWIGGEPWRRYEALT